MTDRRKKLLAAVAVLLAGWILAWPWQRESPPPKAPAGALGKSTTAFKPDVPTKSPTPISPAPLSLAPNSGSPLFAHAPSPTPAALVATGQEGEKPPAPLVPVAPERPPGIGSDFEGEAMALTVHVVHNGDTLQRLAKKYLRDEGRALEIFDLNRDVLTNPHLLPIGAELRIPAD